MDGEAIMKIHKVITLWIIAILCCLSRTSVAFGQTAARNAMAHIPYDFWIGGTHLPAGDYSISTGVASVMVFWNEKANVGEQAFLIPTGHSVASGDYKLIFAVHDSRHYLRAIWDSGGTAVLTTEFHVAPATGDTETEIKLLEQNNDKEIIRARQ
jgi:hypothetical protein